MRVWLSFFFEYLKKNGGERDLHIVEKVLTSERACFHSRSIFSLSQPTVKDVHMIVKLTFFCVDGIGNNLIKLSDSCSFYDIPLSNIYQKPYN